MNLRFSAYMLVQFIRSCIVSILYSMYFYKLTEFLISEQTNRPFEIYPSDMDGDNDIDIDIDIVMIILYNNDNIFWYENEGFNNFTKHTLFESTGYDDKLYAVYTADLDGDEDIDILYGNDRDNDVIWLDNDGSDSFTEHSPPSHVPPGSTSDIPEYSAK